MRATLHVHLNLIDLFALKRPNY